nr:glycoside hydrolase family 13 protein [Desulfitobacterium hafniense]
MEFSAYHNSHDLFFRNPFGAVTCGQKIVFRLGTCSDISIEGCYLRLWEGDKEKILPMNKKIITDNELASFSEAERCCPEIKVSFEKVSFEVEYRTADEPGLVWYYFIIPVDSKTYYFGNNPARAGGVGKLWEQEPPAYQVTVHLPMKVPQWYKKGVMYQIFVDRFYNGNENGSILRPRKKSLIHSDWYDTPFYIKDGQGRVIRWNFFGGNLKGVLKKLPYLKELGVSIIYFNPIFDSSSNHKYDTADYLHIDPMYGDESDFELLVKESAKQGISIILDGVFSHTGSDSIYFNKYGNYPGLGGYQSPDSPYFKWYKFKENPDKYKCWWGVEDLPEVDEMEPSYRQFIYGAENSVIKKWMQLGVKGWRLDVADELPDEFIKELRQAMKQTEPDSVLIGEVWEDASNKISYGKSREYLWGEELDSTMNYPFREIFLQFILGDLDAQIVDKKVMSLYENYPRESFYAAMNLIGSHDRARILTLLGEAPPEEEMSIAERESFSLSAAARNLAVQRLKLL